MDVIRSRNRKTKPQSIFHEHFKNINSQNDQYLTMESADDRLINKTQENLNLSESENRDNESGSTMLTKENADKVYDCYRSENIKGDDNIIEGAVPSENNNNNSNINEALTVAMVTVPESDNERKRRLSGGTENSFVQDENYKKIKYDGGKDIMFQVGRYIFYVTV